MARRVQPRLPTQVSQSAAGKPVIAVKERQSYSRLPVQTHDILKNGAIDAELICRAFNMLQDNVHSATAPTRNDPTSNKKIVQITTKSGTAVSIHHGLGAFVGHWFPTRAFPGSQPFAAVEAAPGSAQWPQSLDPTQWIVLIPSSTGTYNVAFCPA